jgi:hypothetical protein
MSHVRNTLNCGRVDYDLQVALVLGDISIPVKAQRDTLHVSVPNLHRGTLQSLKLL